jgi:FixJ family two-component response regulator
VKRGAFDFIEKPFNGQALLGIVRNAVRQPPAQLVADAKRLAINDRLDSLSAREHEVLLCVLDGKTNKAIATELGIAVKTVECHRARMMEKLGAGSIAELVRLIAGSSRPFLSSEHS